MNNCINLYKEKLSSLPPDWAEKIACVLCADQPEIDCTGCENLTELSVFTIEDTKVCITFKDENGVYIKRCFDFSLFTGQLMNDIDGSCLNSSWETLLDTQKWQEIVNAMCNCCTPPESLYYNAMPFVCIDGNCVQLSFETVIVHSPVGSPLSAGLYYPAVLLSHEGETYLIIGSASSSETSILVDESLGTTDCDLLCADEEVG